MTPLPPASARSIQHYPTVVDPASVRAERARPPNYAEIIKVFPEVATMYGIIYAWNGFVFDPDGVGLTDELRDHEAVHIARIPHLGGAYVWWERYLTDTQFRFDEEVLAHQAEYRGFCDRVGGMGKRIDYLNTIARRLASPMYGNMVNVIDAKRIIREGRR